MKVELLLLSCVSGRGFRSPGRSLPTCCRLPGDAAHVRTLKKRRLKRRFVGIYERNEVRGRAHAAPLVFLCAQEWNVSNYLRGRRG